MSAIAEAIETESAKICQQAMEDIESRQEQGLRELDQPILDKLDAAHAALNPDPPKPQQAEVMLGSLTHDGRIAVETSQAMSVMLSRQYKVATAVASGSLLTMNCNHLWASAIQMYEDSGLKWFAMIHSDVGPEPWWLDKLIAEADRVGADVLSAVIPIKSDDGVTSTAIGDPKDLWEPWARLTMHQVCHPDFPETFDITAAVDALARLPEPYGLKDAPQHRLLVNTGCMIVRLGDWCDGTIFNIRDQISREPDGKRKVCVWPEDWNFSEQAADLGAKVFATRAVKLIHKGNGIFNNQQAYGLPSNKTAKGAA